MLTVKSLSNARHSTHFGCITTTLLHCICVPSTALLIWAPRRHDLLLTASICTTLLLDILALLWLIELIVSYSFQQSWSFFLPVTRSLAEEIWRLMSHRRLFTKSRLTRCLDIFAICSRRRHAMLAAALCAQISWLLRLSPLRLHTSTDNDKIFCYNS
jgi:hypothetical protein